MYQNVCIHVHSRIPRLHSVANVQNTLGNEAMHAITSFCVASFILRCVTRGELLLRVLFLHVGGEPGNEAYRQLSVSGLLLMAAVLHCVDSDQ